MHERANVFSPPLRGLRARPTRHRADSETWIDADSQRPLARALQRSHREASQPAAATPRRLRPRLCPFSRVNMGCAHAPSAVPLTRSIWRIIHRSDEIGAAGAREGGYTYICSSQAPGRSCRANASKHPVIPALLPPPRLSSLARATLPLPARLLSAADCSARTPHTNRSRRRCRRPRKTTMTATPRRTRRSAGSSARAICAGARRVRRPTLPATV